MSSVNLIQLANHLGLSKITVSTGLKDSYEISAATKKRIVCRQTNIDFWL